MHRWDPNDYSRHSGGQEKWARELIAKLGLKGTERILDIGSGDGKVSAELARQVPFGSVLGIDSSVGMVEFARRTFQNTVPNLTFAYIDAREMELADEFDVVFSNATLHWVKNHLPVLVGIRRALRPAGRVLLQMGGKGNVEGILAVLARMMEAESWRSFFRQFDFPYTFHDVGEYQRLLVQAGLIVRRVELIPKDMVHKGRAGLAGFLRTTWHPYVNRVPDEMRTAFIEELVDRYAHNHPPDAEGRLHVQMVRLEVEAAASTA